MFSYSPLRSYSASSPPPSSSSSPPPPHNEGGPAPGPGPDASLSQRLKHLIKTYGWYALGVYIVLSTLDFGIAFAAINVIGAEHVSRVTDALKSQIASVLHSAPPEPGALELEKEPPTAGRESLYAMLVLAYTVHKTLFLPVRVGLTAAFTPKLVGWLGKRGWVGGQGAKRAANEMRERVRRRRDRD